MADRAIRVAVLEGYFASWTSHVTESTIAADWKKAVWTTKSTRTGLAYFGLLLTVMPLNQSKARRNEGETGGKLRPLLI